MSDKLITSGKLITPPSGTFTLSKPPDVMPVGTITLTDAKGDVTYEPQEDITAYECAMIMRLLFRLTLGNANGAIPDWRAFIEEHKIERHFKEQ